MALTYKCSSFIISNELMHFKMVHFSLPTSINLSLQLIIQADDSVSTIMLTFKKLLNDFLFLYFLLASLTSVNSFIGNLNCLREIKMITHQNFSVCFSICITAFLKFDLRVRHTCLAFSLKLLHVVIIGFCVED